MFNNKHDARYAPGNFPLQLANNRHLIEHLPPGYNAFYFGYNVKIRIWRHFIEPQLPP